MVRRRASAVITVSGSYCRAALRPGINNIVDFNPVTGLTDMRRRQ